VTMFNSAFLNIGTPEVALILLVGYFVLGPQDLYKLAKETGE
jgi:Sec-independent protein translocase protein TatA